MALSSVATMAQEGMVRQAAAWETSVSDEAEKGRWVARMSRVVATGRSAAKAARNLSACR